MELPTLSPFQFLLLHLLFVGPQTGPQLRRALAGYGLRRSQPTFSRTMMQLAWKGYVRAEQVRQSAEGQVVHPRRYEVTDFGVMVWLNTQSFYQNLAPPSADLVPVATEEGELAAYDAETHQWIIRQRTREERKQFTSLAEPLYDALLRQSRRRE